jgi:TolB protein
MPGRLSFLCGALLLLAACTSSVDPTRAPTPSSMITGWDASPQPVATATAYRPHNTPVRTMIATLEPPDPSPIPETPDPKPEPFPWLLAFDSDTTGDDEVYLLAADGDAVNLTRHPSEDRRPAWSPDGARIAFQSHRDGNWEIYTLELASGELQRLTRHPAYDGAPAWSPDGDWIVFESYRDEAPCPSERPLRTAPPCPDLELYRVPAQGGPAERLTDSPGADCEPTYSPDGRWIAFTSWRAGHREVFLIPATGGPAQRVTESTGPGAPGTRSADSWAPAWTPDGSALVLLSERDGTTELYRQPLDGPARRLTENERIEGRPALWPDGGILFARYDPGPSFEAHDPYRGGAQHLYRLPDGGALQPLPALAGARHPAAAPLAVPPPPMVGGPGATLPSALLAADQGSPQTLIRLEDISGADARLASSAAQAFDRWRDAVRETSGYDYLGRVSDMFRPAAYYGHRLGYLSWHKTGRAVDLLFDWHDDQGGEALYVVREDVAGETYWRLYLKCALQDGSLGEPLTQGPWYFWWHSDPDFEPERQASGGRRLALPPGYFVDVTALAARYGWSRIASYHLEDFHWQRDSTATEYWHYQYSEALTWYEAMAQIYPQERLQELFSRPVAAAREQSQEVMDGKGLPH